MVQKTNKQKKSVKKTTNGSGEKTVINIKTDKELKQEAQQVAKEMGVPLGTIINAYLRDVVRNREVTFSAPEVPNERTAKIMDEIDKDRKKDVNFHGPFKTPDEVDDFLARCK